jgi:hypothetical protein
MTIPMRAIHMERTGPIEYSITHREGDLAGGVGSVPLSGSASGVSRERFLSKSSIITPPERIRRALVSEVNSGTGEE